MLVTELFKPEKSIPPNSNGIIVILHRDRFDNNVSRREHVHKHCFIREQPGHVFGDVILYHRNVLITVFLFCRKKMKKRHENLTLKTTLHKFQELSAV